jgi:competence protein ComEC
MVFLAMLFDRSGTPMRIVAIAALYIFIIAPENIISPSFQMSFGAVIGLISAFQWLAPKLQKFAAIYKIPRILMEVISTIISSLIATAATAPFAIYHFNRNSPYGILANILAIPVTSFWVMPFGVVAMVLMPIHLEWLVAWPLSKGVDFIIWVSYYFASLPYANSTIPAINDWQLLLISLGFLWLSLWKTRLRLLGLSMVVIAIIGTFFNKNPDIIINGDATIFAVKNESGELLFSSSKGGKYVKNVWTARMGQEEIVTIDESDSKIISCDNAACIYKKNGYKTVFIKQPVALESECGGADIFINMTSIKYNCPGALKQINLYNLKQKGVHAIFLENGIVIKTVASGRGRIWE